MAHPLHSRRVRPGRYVKGKCQQEETLEIYYDEYPENPREQYDPLGKMLCFSQRYILGDEHDLHTYGFESWDALEDYLRREDGAIVTLPLYLYDHSGLAMNTTGYACPWDSGRVGVVYATREAVCEAFGCKEPSPEDLVRAKRILVAEVQEYDDYLRGDVYWFKLMDADGNEIDCCHGFYGESGIEAILEETGFEGVEAE